MDAVSRASLEAGRGIVGNADQGGRRQVTLLSADHWTAVTQGLGVSIDPVSRRANLLVSGVDLAESGGRVLLIGSCRVSIGGETRPCRHMDEASVGLQAALRDGWGGGAYAEVLNDGVIEVGDEVRWDD